MRKCKWYGFVDGTLKPWMFGGSEEAKTHAAAQLLLFSNLRLSNAQPGLCGRTFPAECSSSLQSDWATGPASDPDDPLRMRPYLSIAWCGPEIGDVLQVVESCILKSEHWWLSLNGLKSIEHIW